MTDGKIYLDSEGKEIKVFNIYDGQGISLLKRHGIEIGLLSGRQSEAVVARSKELGISDIYQGVSNKQETYEALLKQKGLKDEEVAFIGDDLIDIPVMERVGLSVAVSNAVSEVKEIAHLTTKKKGGEGAVREFAEKLLKLKGIRRTP